MVMVRPASDVHDGLVQCVCVCVCVCWPCGATLFRVGPFIASGLRIGAACSRRDAWVDLMVGLQSEVEETLKRIQGHKGVLGVVIFDKNGRSPPLPSHQHTCSLRHYRAGFCLCDLAALVTGEVVKCGM
jgi:hypothetical protein